MDTSELQHTLGDWLRELCGVTSFTDRCRFTYDDRFELSVELRAEDRAVLLAATVAGVPAQDRQRFCERLLIMNHPAGDLGGACLALNSTAQDVLLWYQAPIADMGMDEFQQMLAAFIELAARLNTELRADADATGAPDPDDRQQPPAGPLVFHP